MKSGLYDVDHVVLDESDKKLRNINALSKYHANPGVPL